MLTDSELEGMRETLVKSLGGSAIIQSNQWVTDGGGGGTTSWVSGGTFACRIAPVASVAEGQVVDGGRLQPDTEYIFTFEHGVPITDDSRIVYESRNFDVTSLREPRTWGISTRVEAKEVV